MACPHSCSSLLLFVSTVCLYRRVQLGPVLDLWQQLASSAPGLLNKKGAGKDSSAGGSAGGPATAGACPPYSPHFLYTLIP